MRTVVDASRVTYAFDATAAPIAVVASGTALTIHTRDAYDGKASALDVEAYRRARVPGRMNPCTGPIAVQGAQPGDTLAVTIEAIRVAPRGYVAALPGTGLLADEPAPPGIEPFDVEGEAVRFAGRVMLPLRPMIGTIGVAPAEGRSPR